MIFQKLRRLSESFSNPNMQPPLGQDPKLSDIQNLNVNNANNAALPPMLGRLKREDKLHKSSDNLIVGL